MYIRTNDNFKKILGKTYLNKIEAAKSLFSLRLARAKVIDAGGCYYLDLVAPPSSKFCPAIADKVGKECFENRILIDDYIDRKLDNKSYLLQGCKFGLNLAEKLSKLAPSKFKVIVSFQKGRKYYTKVTFHKIRKGTVYLKRNLNSYKINGLMVIYT